MNKIDINNFVMHSIRIKLTRTFYDGTNYESRVTIRTIILEAIWNNVNNVDAVIKNSSA